MNLQPIAPWWLLVPIILGLLAYGAFLGWRHRGHLQTWAKANLWYGAMALLVIIMAIGPSVPGGHSAPGFINLDVLFVVDTTESMGALDYNGTNMRLDGVKKDILALSARMTGARFALITFDSTAQLVLPFTADESAVSNAVGTMNREVYVYSQGSRIDKPITLMTTELQKSKQQHPDRGRLVFYMGDGEQTANSPVKSFGSLASFVKGGAVLGYGTSHGAKMMNYTGFNDINNGQTDFGSPYVQTLNPANNEFEDAISRIDETALEKIAAQMKIPYVNRDSGGPIEPLLTTSKAQVVADHSREVGSYIHLYWLFACLLVVLLIRELDGIVRTLRELKPAEGAES